MEGMPSGLMKGTIEAVPSCPTKGATNMEVKKWYLPLCTNHYTGLPLRWKTFLENTTRHQQHWAYSIHKSPSKHLLSDRKKEPLMSMLFLFMQPFCAY